MKTLFLTLTLLLSSAALAKPCDSIGFGYRSVHDNNIYEDYLSFNPGITCNNVFESKLDVSYFKFNSYHNESIAVTRLFQPNDLERAIGIDNPSDDTTWFGPVALDLGLRFGASSGYDGFKGIAAAQVSLTYKRAGFDVLYMFNGTTLLGFRINF